MKSDHVFCRKYLRVVDYHFLSNYAMKSALLSVINRVEDYETDTCSEDVRVAFLREVLKMWQTAKKEDTTGRNSELADTMLAQAYLRLVDGMDKAHCPVSQIVGNEILRHELAKSFTDSEFRN